MEQTKTNLSPSSPRTFIVLYIQDRTNKFLCIKQMNNEFFEFPKQQLTDLSIAQTIESIGQTQLGFTISPLDCRLKTVVEEVSEDNVHNVYITYGFRLLRDVLLTAWADTQEMVFCADEPSVLNQIDKQILSQVRR